VYRPGVSGSSGVPQVWRSGGFWILMPRSDHRGRLEPSFGDTKLPGSGQPGWLRARCSALLGGQGSRSAALSRHDRATRTVGTASAMLPACP
jgi:hypothetical protein